MSAEMDEFMAYWIERMAHLRREADLELEVYRTQRAKEIRQSEWLPI